MHTHYKVTVADSVTTALDWNRSVIEVDADENELVIDASQTAFSQSQSSDGLLYSW